MQDELKRRIERMMMEWLDAKPSETRALMQRLPLMLERLREKEEQVKVRKING